MEEVTEQKEQEKEQVGLYLPTITAKTVEQYNIILQRVDINAEQGIITRKRPSKDGTYKVFQKNWVTIRYKNTLYTVQRHRLVAYSVIGRKLLDLKMKVYFIDGDKTNASIGNLRYKYAQRDADDEMRLLYATGGYTQPEIARMFNRRMEYVSNLLRDMPRKTYKKRKPVEHRRGRYGQVRHRNAKRKWKKIYTEYNNLLKRGLTPKKAHAKLALKHYDGRTKAFVKQLRKWTKEIENG